MPSDRQRAIKAAQRTTARLKLLFNKMGNAEHPRGALLSSYRTARRALKGNVDNPAAVRDAFMTLRASIRDSSQSLLSSAGELGTEQAETELTSYGMLAGGVQTAAQEAAALAAVLAVVGAQEQRVNAALLSGADIEAIVLGDGTTRLGLVQPAPVQQELGRMITAMTLFGYSGMIRSGVERAGAQTEFKRQAIAAIDERTTDCCLRVHGQVVGLDEMFRLTGTPRFADKIHAPPFHWYCRTAVTLVRVDDVADATTQRMQEAARAELTARDEATQKVIDLQRQLAEAGAAPDARARADDTRRIKDLRARLRAAKGDVRVMIHPASARSTRGRPG